MRIYFLKGCHTQVDHLFIELRLPLSHVKQMFSKKMHLTYELILCIQITRGGVDFKGSSTMESACLHFVLSLRLPLQIFFDLHPYLPCRIVHWVEFMPLAWIKSMNHSLVHTWGPRNKKIPGLLLGIELRTLRSIGQRSTTWTTVESMSILRFESYIMLDVVTLKVKRCKGSKEKVQK